jgi:hypothetical protein
VGSDAIHITGYTVAPKIAGALMGFDYFRS